MNDILLLQPELASELDRYKNSTIKLTVNAKGLLTDINIPEVSVSGIGSTSFAFNGNIKGLPDPRSAFYNINIAKFVTTGRDVLGFIPPSTMPSSIRIPKIITVSGYFKGTATAFNSKLDLKPQMVTQLSVQKSIRKLNNFRSMQC